MLTLLKFALNILFRVILNITSKTDSDYREVTIYNRSILHC